MPVVFSPGEAETRPLDPDAIVYTTAQKVAELLGIGPQEAVLVSSDTTLSVIGGAANDVAKVYITGTDYRNIGFSVDDTILVYSDADPLGFTATITEVVSTSNGVGLAFISEGLDVTKYQAADNTYVQNEASFTNGRTRGVTKNHVEHLIKIMQDKIDNLTHNAWRPYLVTGEYINFDTYKPYRRRYYTDYVGTAPLLFRNLQQVLRIELWQGDDYREIGSAEIRVKFGDISALSGDSIYLSPGNGSVGTMTVGTGTNNWRADFDDATAAQNLSDLINKEDRVSKSRVTFDPAFTLEGSSNQVGVHNEFLATSNADYGTGVTKITSMRGVKGGETCTIATSDTTNVLFSQGGEAETTSTSVSSTTVNVASTDGFVNAGLLQVGEEVLRYTGKTATSFTGCVNVSGTPLTTLNSSGTTATQTQFMVDLQGGSSAGDVGRLRDWWCDHEMGIIYFNNSYPFFEWNAIKVAYVYGERYVEKAIEDICTKLVAIDLILADDRSVLIPEGTQNIDLTSKVQLYKADVERNLPRYIEVVAFE
tara:strand:+ start:10851 stop:12458 length:1608 start_codon:yes stop_codon:yes gene_type:complete